VSWKTWLKDQFKRSWEHNGIQAAMVFCGIGAAGLGIFWFLNVRLREKTAEWYHDRTPAFDPDKIYEWCVATHESHEAMCGRLAEQALTAKMRATFHFDLFSYYSAEHYAAISVAFWASIFTAACLAYLVKRGWENAHNVMATAFVGFSITVAFYGGYPALAKHEDNITDNEFLYLEHQNLLQSMRTFCVTGTVPRRVMVEVAPDKPDAPLAPEDPVEQGERWEEMTFQTYIGYVDERLQTLNRIPMEFDASQIDIGSTKFLETQAEMQ